MDLHLMSQLLMSMQSAGSGCVCLSPNLKFLWAFDFEQFYSLIFFEEEKLFSKAT